MGLPYHFTPGDAKASWQQNHLNMISLLHLLVYYLLAELILGIVYRTALCFIYTIRHDILKEHTFSLYIPAVSKLFSLLLVFLVSKS